MEKNTTANNTADLEDTEDSTLRNTTDPAYMQSMRRNIKRLLTLNTVILIACIMTLGGRIYTNATAARTKQKHDKWSYFVFEVVIMIMGIMNAIFGLCLAMFERKRYPDHQFKKNCKLLDFNRLNMLHLIFNILCGSLFTLFFIIELVRWCSNLLDDDQVHNGIRMAIILLALIIGLCQGACAIGNRVLAWTPKYRYSRFFLFFISIILIAISIASVVFNARVYHRGSANGLTLWQYKIFEASSAYTFLCGLIGFGLTFVYGKKRNGPNKFRKHLRYFFNIFCLIDLVLILVFIVILLCYHPNLSDQAKLNNVYTLTHSNLLLSTVQCVLLVLCMRTLNGLISATKIGRNGLIAERIDLSNTSSAYSTYWATAIDQFNDTPDGMTGDAALQLMKAYENGGLENIECVVLRVSRSGRRISIANDEWDDTEALVLFTIIHSYDVTIAANLNGFWSKILKRTIGSENCTKHFRPLMLRLGLIGYQWPFRTSIFFTAPHENPLLRAAHVLETVIDWNEMQKSNLHCHVLLLPTFSTELIAKAIPVAGFFPLPLPPTHLLDLRPHRGKTWPEYMKTLKKGNRRPYIQQFLAKGGTIEEVHDIKPHEVGQAVCEQWENIAQIRRENKEPPTLAKPTPEFITSMGFNMNEAYRSVVFLRINNEVIASSVIYKFPNKLITTDIQGLTHEKARPFKAYFVMSQWVIREALDKKYDFVDFGPTTPGPKMDLGCVQVPLEAGGYAGNPILAFGIQQAGSNVDSTHKKKDNQQQDTSDQDGKEQDDTQPDIQASASKNATPRQTPANNPKAGISAKKQQQMKNLEKPENLTGSQTNIRKSTIVTIENETPAGTPIQKKNNVQNNKAQGAPNASNQPNANTPKNKQAMKNLEKSENVMNSQTNIPEATTVTIENETPAGTPTQKKNDIPNKGKAAAKRARKLQEALAAQAVNQIKSSDAVPESNDVAIKETPQKQQHVDVSKSTDTDSQTNIPEATTVIIENETPAGTPTQKKNNIPNKGKAAAKRARKLQEALAAQAASQIKSSDTVPESNDVTMEETLQTQEHIDESKSTDTVPESTHLITKETLQAQEHTDESKSTDTVPQSNNETIKERSQAQQHADVSESTDTVIPIIDETSVSLPNPLVNENMNKETKHDNDEKLDGV
ncbi:unnamed protein product [Adineta steineri]|uniref:BioF2-like acetyltransferase domain-containing protein n=2 Tax=Adineta steineri TaxID=433720 RepID=A0A813WXA4_9BILA|nr:unnamed protein product [Adineta steineri]CAF3801907.1 unnamed protein product [Adineta steineri]